MSRGVMMEAKCQHVDMASGWPPVPVVCGAPIPRLPYGECERCGWTQSFHGINRDITARTCHTYLGPLASKCAAGHPVAVPTEEPAP